MSRDLFMKAAVHAGASDQTCYGTGTSIVCRDLMDLTGAYFPDAHLDAETMADLAIAGHTVLGLDVVMPLFSVCHDAAGLGCNVDWGGPDAMPEPGKPIWTSPEDVAILDGFLGHPACRVALDAIGLLKGRLGDDAAVCGKIFGGWSLGYHLFGVEQFLIGTIDDPAGTHRILDSLMPATLAFGRAQIDAGADCLLLADHATRDLCSPDAYDEFLKARHAHIAAELDVPVILHICGNTSDRIAMIAETGLECFHWDTRTGPAVEVRRLAGDRMSLMGGVDNLILLNGAPEQVAAQAGEAAEAGIDIVGPECAIPLRTPLANLKAVVQGRS